MPQYHRECGSLAVPQYHRYGDCVAVPQYHRESGSVAVQQHHGECGSAIVPESVVVWQCHSTRDVLHGPTQYSLKWKVLRCNFWNIIQFNQQSCYIYCSKNIVSLLFPLCNYWLQFFTVRLFIRLRLFIERHLALAWCHIFPILPQILQILQSRH